MSTLWGPTCSAVDQIVEKALLPQLHIDDCIIFENMGAYTFVMSTNFNGFPIPRIYNVVSGNT